jgi:hypothetical protein
MRDDMLTRDQFREGVFARDGHRCVICGQPAADAHHLIERRAWGESCGYLLDNGVSVCEPCHLAAEATTLSCEELRAAAKITRVVLPGHLYADQRYDKWTNPILDNGQRLRGELFDDESVQKILAPVLHLFTNRVKYPRTFHLPWSPGILYDDRMLASLTPFEGQEVVVTAKCDGENTTMYRDYMHARSLEFTPHPSRDRVRALHGRLAHEIPENWRLCGENLYAKHAIHYHHLAAHFLLFSVWDEKNICQSWDDTVTYAGVLDLKTVPVLWRGKWDEALVRRLYQPKHEDDECEGYVVRMARAFHFREFRQVLGKYVRQGHVIQHGGHWANRVVVPNELKGA